MKRLLLIVLTLLSLSIPAAAQDTLSCPLVSTKGTDFWVMFLYNMNISSTYQSLRQIIVTGEETTNIYIEGPGVDDNFTLTGGSYDDNHAYGSNALTIATPFNGGYHITSQHPIHAYARNHVYSTQDIATLLPTYALGNRYIVQDYPSSQYGGEVGFVAIEDSTTLTMTVPCAIQGTDITAGTTLTPTLHRGESYMLMAQGINASLSGMVVTGNKPFAMFQGAWNPAIPVSGTGRDHCYEQALPDGMWGTDFIVPGAAGQGGQSYVRVTAAEDGCTVSINGVVAATLNANATHEFGMASTDVKHIVTSKPACVILYLASYTSGGNFGDPSSVTIPPVDAGICESRFILTNSTELNSHYLCIVCDTAWDEGMTLDGNGLMPSSTTNGYSIFRFPTSAGLHRLANNQGAFIAYAYGLGNYESYAFSLGFEVTLQTVRDTVHITDTICMNSTYDSLGFILTPTAAGTVEQWMPHCIGDSVSLYHLTLTVLPLSSRDTSFLIPFGDTLFYLGDTLTQAGSYPYTFTDIHGCDSLVTLHISFVITRDTVHIVDTICINSTYDSLGFTVTPTDTGTVEYWLPKPAGNSMCYYHLTLTVLPLSSIDSTILIVFGDTLFFQGDTLTEAGSYLYIFSDSHGCDSLATIHLGYEEVDLTASAYGVCPGDSLTLTAHGVHHVHWSANPPDPSLDTLQDNTSVTVTPWQTTIYTIRTDSGGDYLGSIKVNVEPPPTLCVHTSIPIVEYDHPVVIFQDCSEGSTSSRWLFSDGVTVTALLVHKEFFQPLPDSVTAILTSCNPYECCADTTITLPVKIISIWFPNVFTPNGEENRDFGCITSAEVENFSLTIYDRWGLLIWESADVTERWDGTRDGRPVPQATYTYCWRLKDQLGIIHNGIGTVTLLR